MKFNIHNWKSLGVIVLLGLITTSCYNNKAERNIEFSPNMYNSLPLEPYSRTVYGETNYGGNYAALDEGVDEIRYFDNGLPAQKPVEGTVPRAESWYYQEAYSPYPYGNSVEEYERAGAELTSPLNDSTTNEGGFNCTEATYQRGKETYEVFCIMCHGEKGDGNGNLVTSEVYPQVPSYYGPTLKDLPAGKMFHTLTYGKNLMGSYASQITPQERWEVICYIQEFQKQAAQ
ncbi:MAG: cytochrome c [Bacteroidota bacterium]